MSSSYPSRVTHAVWPLAAQTRRATGSYKGQPLTLAADVDMLALDSGTDIALSQGRMRELKESRDANAQRIEDDGATAVCRPRTQQVVNRIVSAELIFVLAQLAL